MENERVFSKNCAETNSEESREGEKKLGAQKREKKKKSSSFFSTKPSRKNIQGKRGGGSADLEKERGVRRQKKGSPGPSGLGLQDMKAPEKGARKVRSKVIAT